MSSTPKADFVLEQLLKPIGGNYCALLFRSPYELTVATILSAQCTDKRVNMVTPTFFEQFPDPQHLANASIERISKAIASISFPNNKAKHLQGFAQGVMERFQGQVPDTMEELITLPGIARKTANVVLIHGFGKIDGIPVDTHVLRVAHRIGLTSSPKDPIRTEQELQALYPQEAWPLIGTALIHHGRNTCIARAPLCGQCAIASVCTYFTNMQS